MARNHFAIERPRKISISIQGYDAQAVTQAQQKKRLERSKRQNRKAAETQPSVPADATPLPIAPPQQQSASQVVANSSVAAPPLHDENDIEDLGIAAAGKTRGTFSEERRNALADGSQTATGAHHANE
jgi:hypothetical protein